MSLKILIQALQRAALWCMIPLLATGTSLCKYRVETVFSFPPRGTATVVRVISTTVLVLVRKSSFFAIREAALLLYRTGGVQ
jgi:hypothetical protein